MKLVIICECLEGGVRKHIFSIINNLPLNKYKIYFIYSSNRADGIFFHEISKLDNRIKLYDVVEMKREINFKNDLIAFFKIFNILIKVKPDIVHCHSSKAGVLGRIAARLLLVKKIIYTPHAYIMQSFSISKKENLFYGTIEKILSRYFTSLTINVSIGEYDFALENKIDSPFKFKVIYNGLYKNVFLTESQKIEIRNEFGFSQDDILIGVAARLDDQKDPMTFFKIAKNILNKNYNVKFMYIGDGKYFNTILKKVLGYKLEDRFILAGFSENVWRLIQIFDIYLFTSTYEGLPYSLIEAIMAGLPILATNIRGNTEIVQEDVNGMLFQVKDINEAILKLNTMLCNKDMLTKMSKNSYSIFSKNFTIEKMMFELEAVYKRALNFK